MKYKGLLLLVISILTSCQKEDREFIIQDKNTGLGYIVMDYETNDTLWGYHYYDSKGKPQIITENSKNFTRIKQGLPVIDYSTYEITSQVGTGTLNGMVVYEYDSLGGQANVVLHSLGHADLAKHNLTISFSKDTLSVKDSITVSIFAAKGSEVNRVAYSIGKSKHISDIKENEYGLYEFNVSFDKSGNKVVNLHLFNQERLILNKSLQFYVKSKNGLR